MTQAPHRLSATRDPDVLVVFITCNFISLKHVHHPAASSPSTHSLNPAPSPPPNTRWILHHTNPSPPKLHDPSAGRSHRRCAPLPPPAALTHPYHRHSHHQYYRHMWEDHRGVGTARVGGARAIGRLLISSRQACPSGMYARRGREENA